MGKRNDLTRPGQAETGDFPDGHVGKFLNLLWHLLEKPFSLDTMIQHIGMFCQEQGADMAGNLFNSSLVKNYEQEKRGHTRRPHVQPINFAGNRIIDGAIRQFSSRGILTDLSDHGSGMLTHEPLQAGQIVRYPLAKQETTPQFRISPPLLPPPEHCNYLNN